jgi:Ring finger domain
MDDEDIESSCVTRNVGKKPVLASDTQQDEDAQSLYLRLPVNDDHGNPRIVDGQCAICVSEYQPDDKIVWSGLQECQHAFHAACILPWLANGKKRCPTCRQSFVPPGTGTRVEDPKQERDEGGLRTESEPTAPHSEITEETSDDDSQSSSTNSSPAIGLDTTLRLHTPRGSCPTLVECHSRG